jgi:amphi-Trp domain-containing protein
VRDGVRYTVDVPDEVRMKLEIEVGDEGSEIEVELSW